jgi:hypothetical protein
VESDTKQIQFQQQSYSCVRVYALGVLGLIQGANVTYENKQEFSTLKSYKQPYTQFPPNCSVSVYKK